ncbi:MAG: glycosyltransferase [Pusillimonas sp.]
MKILFTNFHHRNGGGHVTYIVNLLRGLAATDSLSVATPGTSRLFRQAQAFANVTTYDMCFTSRIGPMIHEVLQLRQLIKREKFDVIHVNASADHRHVMLALAGLSRRPKVVWTKHNDHGVSSFGHRLRARFGTDAIIAVSDFVRGMLARSPYAALPTHVIRHGIDLSHFKPVSSAEKQQLRTRLLGNAADGLLVFGSSGGTDLEKGWLDLVRAVAGLPDDFRSRIRIVVAGDPPKPERQAQVAALGMTSSVIFPGLVTDVRDILAACDVGFVLSYREALSFACRETLALGLPTLVSDAGGLPENIVPGHTGWVVPAANIEAIRACVQSIISNDSMLSAMGVHVRQYSEAEFALDRFCADTRAVYSSCLDPKALDPVNL